MLASTTFLRIYTHSNKERQGLQLFHFSYGKRLFLVPSPHLNVRCQGVVAQIALERKMVHSVAKVPVDSHAQTIEKNIRDDVYNHPKLVFVYVDAQGRLISLPEWNSKVSTAEETSPKLTEIKVKIPSELFEKIKLAEQAKLKNDFDETVSFLLSKGLSIVAADIKKGLMTQLDSLNSL